MSRDILVLSAGVVQIVLILLASHGVHALKHRETPDRERQGLSRAGGDVSGRHATAQFGSSSTTCTTCDWTSGSWAPDETLPLYSGATCPFVRGSQNCLKFGKPDMSFQKWRWVPKGCQLQHLTPQGLAEALKDKVVVVVGDSVSKNLGTSILCILNAAAAPGSSIPFQEVIRGVEVKGTLFPSLNVRFVSFFSNALNNATFLPGGSKALRIDLDQLDPRIETLLPATDVLLLQATHWWTNPLNKFFWQGRQQKRTSLEAYREGLRSINRILRRKGYKGRALLVSVSPTHYDLPPAIQEHHKSCDVTTPLTAQEAEYVAASDDVAAEFLRWQRSVTSGVSPMQLVDVTWLSQFRADGHLSSGMGAPPGVRQDCLHWCEGGVTDTWVELAYNRLLCGPKAE